MKGLMLKDIYNMKGYGRSLLFIIVIFALAFKEQGSATLIVMFTIMSSILIINSLAQDEMYKWYHMALSMPVTCRQLVLAKYIVSAGYAFAALLTGAAVSFILQAAGWFPGEDFIVMLAVMAISFLIALLFIAVIIPVNLKFGVQKGRLLLLSLVALPLLLTLVIASLGVAAPSVMFYGLSPYVIVLGSFAAVAVLVVISYFISVRIMKKKEF